ncbi:YciC family protein [Acerihabitans sp. TG2]|uniref:YciC family protein n=1 Tax=Acerihabitans sp. TG2 TaxID=3096008 RepID=UPI002B23DF54|nr:YciC family protein [Acerihabitans sp. TG2]MEA9389442.1 YciC family protein [Acerihabitans sp. TG2]
MPIMASTLYRDTLNFTRNQFASIVLLALLTALVSVVLGHALSPSTDQLVMMGTATTDATDTATMSLQDLVQQMTPEQQSVLLKASAAGTIAGLVGNVILAGALLTMIKLVSDRQPVSVLRAVGLSLPILPRLLLLVFITTLLVQLGLLLIVVPGILIAIALSLAPVIATSENLGAFKSMRLSSKMAFANVRLIMPAVVIWLFAKAAVLLLAVQFTEVSSLIAAVLLNGLSNIISALLLIYLYRLYMLLRQA